MQNPPCGVADERYTVSETTTGQHTCKSKILIKLNSVSDWRILHNCNDSEGGKTSCSSNPFSIWRHCTRLVRTVLLSVFWLERCCFGLVLSSVGDRRHMFPRTSDELRIDGALFVYSRRFGPSEPRVPAQILNSGGPTSKDLVLGVYYSSL